MPRRTAVLFLLAVGAAASVAAVSAAPGTTVAPISLTAPRTGSSVRFPARGARLAVVSFVELGTRSTALRTDSRGEVTVLLSLARQYRAKGLQIVLVAYASGRPAPSRSQIVDATYDWRLDALPLLADPSRRGAAAYRVGRAPTTVLIRADGRIVRRWSGFVPPGPLALAVQAALP